MSEETERPDDGQQHDVDELEPLDLGRVSDLTRGSFLGTNFDGGARWVG